MSKCKIMIVDDDALPRANLKRILKSIDFHEIIESTSGRDALHCYQKFKPKIIFLDIDMPGMDGLEVFERLEAIQSNIQVVMVSAHSTADNVVRALALGAKGFVVKPYTGQKVISIIEKLNTQP